MLKIYGVTQSRTYRILWLAHEMGISHEHIPVTTRGDAPECKADWFRAINPNGRVPAIDNDGFRLWESFAIAIYLAKKFKSDLYPRTVEGEARMLQWAFFMANDFEMSVADMLRNRLLLPEADRDEALAVEGWRRLQGPLAVLEAELGRQPFLAGAAWGLADFAVACVCTSLLLLKADLAAYPKFAAWLKASAARPAARAAARADPARGNSPQ